MNGNSAIFSTDVGFYIGAFLLKARGPWLWHIQDPYFNSPIWLILECLSLKMSRVPTMIEGTFLD